MPSWLTDPWLADWLHLLARWFHLVVGAGWIGASFYFNWLNNQVRSSPEDPDGVAGGLWAVHGGAFYRVLKYKGAPARLPETLHWFKWEAYLTWLSGLLLMLLVYWRQAGLMMLPPGSPLAPWQGALLGVGSLVLGWLLYDGLCRGPLARRPRVLALVLGLLLTAAALGLSQVFTARAAWMHTGAIMGTMMALNVFFVIIPGQRAMVQAMIEGRPPPLERGAAGAMRSLHNNYLTLPVLFVMVSNHFPFASGGPLSWAVLLGIGLVGVAVRHAWNLSDRGRAPAWLLPGAALAMAGLAFVVHGPRSPTAALPLPDEARIDALAQARCAPCHAEQPTWGGLTAPPKGLVLTSAAHLRARTADVHAQAVASTVMPLGNVTAMTEEERALLGLWLSTPGSP